MVIEVQLEPQQIAILSLGLAVLALQGTVMPGDAKAIIDIFAPAMEAAREATEDNTVDTSHMQ